MVLINSLDIKFSSFTSRTTQRHSLSSLISCQVLVEYTDADNCSRAHRALTGLVFNNWTVITSYFPTGKTSMPGIFSPVLLVEHSGLGRDESKEELPRKRSRNSSTERYGDA